MEIAEQIVKQEKTLGPITKDKQNWSGTKEILTCRLSIEGRRAP